VETRWCTPTTSRAQPHELIQEFLNYSGIQARSIRFDSVVDFGQSDHFKPWSKVKGTVLCSAVNYNHTLNSKSECYVRITKEHLRCMLLSLNAPRRVWPFALRYFCRIFGWWPHSNTSGIIYEMLRPLYVVPSSPCVLHKTLDCYFKSERIHERQVRLICLAPPRRCKICC